MPFCRGAQLVNVAFGGTLYQDVATQLPDSGRHVTDGYEKHLHEIRFAPGSGLARLYGGGPGYVLAVQWHPEFHHAGNQGALDCAPILGEFLQAARGA